MPSKKDHVTRTGREFTGTAEQFDVRHNLPYGRWTCADGREVLFNRFYEPIYQRLPGKKACEADPLERVPFMSQEWFYLDADTEAAKRDKAIEGLRAIRAHRD